jgi:hypothetical protein
MSPPDLAFLATSTIPVLSLSPGACGSRPGVPPFILASQGKPTKGAMPDDRAGAREVTGDALAGLGLGPGLGLGGDVKLPGSWSPGSHPLRALAVRWNWAA